MDHPVIVTVPAGYTDLADEASIVPDGNIQDVVADGKNIVFRLTMLNNAFKFEGSGTTTAAEFLGEEDPRAAFYVAHESDAENFGQAIIISDRALPGLTRGTSYTIYKAFMLNSAYEIEVTYVTEVDPDEVEVAISGTQQLAVTTTRNGAEYNPETVTYESDDTDIATVSAGGLVTGVAAGEATITIDVDGLSTATVAVTVTA